MNGAEALLGALEKEGVQTIFGYPGGAIMPVYDALLDSKIDHILTRHEQGAVFAADGFARSTGKVGVCLATSGPGATNLLTGIANAHMDSVPMVVITGQVGRGLLGTDAFQEVDIVGMSLPVVKDSILVESADGVASAIHRAFQIAGSGRPGPVLVDLPKDVQQESLTEDRIAAPELPEATPATCSPDGRDVEECRRLMAQAERPVIYAGGGIGISGAVSEFVSFAESLGAPVVFTLQGLGALPGDHPQSLGMLGMHGWPAANLAVHRSDLLIVVGARLDDRATGKIETFAPDANLVHIDIDPAELGKLRRPSIAVVADLAKALPLFRGRIGADSWLESCRSCDDRRVADQAKGELSPAKLLRRLVREMAEDAVVSCDVGLHQMWVAQHLNFSNPRQHLTSGGLGAMGYGVPAGIGALCADPEFKVLTVTGDGSFMMNIQELATITRYRLPLKILLIDNARLGMVRQWQELFNAERYSEVDLSDNPDFVEVAKAFGIPGRHISKNEEIDDGIHALLSATGPYLLQASIHPEDKVWPIVPAGQSNQDMLTGEPS